MNTNQQATENGICTVVGCGVRHALISLTALLAAVVSFAPQATNANPPNGYRNCTYAFPYSPTGTGCPSQFTTRNVPTGYIDGISRSAVVGWAEDYDISTAIYVHVYQVVNGQRSFVTYGLANLYRGDNNIQYHGFNLPANFTPGATVEVYAIGVSGVQSPVYPFCLDNRVDCGEPDGVNPSLPTSGISRIVR